MTSENPSRRWVCDAGRITDGLRILDVGCGFGGTIDHLNQRFSGAELVGLHIDGRQLRRALELVKARPGNTVDFVEGDACNLPFASGHFDVVLAVECAFHFRSRKQFVREVSRVNKLGGSLALTDFILPPDGKRPPGTWNASHERATCSTTFSPSVFLRKGVNAVQPATDCTRSATAAGNKAVTASATATAIAWRRAASTLR